MDAIYDELRALAGSYFRDQPAAHTLQPTALVHEAFIKVAARAALRRISIPAEAAVTRENPVGLLGQGASTNAEVIWGIRAHHKARARTSRPGLSAVGQTTDAQVRPTRMSSTDEGCRS